MTSDISSKSMTDVLKEIFLDSMTGTLVASNDDTVRELLFEKGKLVGAMSTDPAEELGEWLVSIGKLSPANLETAAQKDPSRQLLGEVLEGMGLFKSVEITELQELQAQEIFYSCFTGQLSSFEFKPGKIFLDESQKLSLPIPNLIFKGVHRITSPDVIHRGLKGDDRLIRLSSKSDSLAIEVNLSPEEAFILSRIDSATSISEILQLSPLGIEKTERVLYGFLSTGIVEFVTHNQGGSGSPSTSPRSAYSSAEIPRLPQDESGKDSMTSQEIEEVKADVYSMLDTARNNSFYELLGVTPSAGIDEIKKAYYALAKKFHPDRYHHSGVAEIKEALETIFSTLSQAYETLKVPATRTSYDAKIFKLDTPTPTPEKKPSSGAAAGPGQQKLAELNYRQGRGYFDQQDYWSAIQAFRQSVRLEPGNARYRYWLGMALTRNPKWRREAEEHFLKAIEIDQFKADYYAGLGLLYKEVGMAKRALGQFNRALQLEPENRMALEGLSSLPEANQKKTGLATLKNLFRLKK